MQSQNCNRGSVIRPTVALQHAFGNNRAERFDFLSQAEDQSNEQQLGSGPQREDLPEHR